jgi:hypothetical protein
MIKEASWLRKKEINIKLVDNNDKRTKVNLCGYMSDKLNLGHSSCLSFSAEKGTTIENFFLVHKMERAKELIFYEEQTLAGIAHRLHYSSRAYPPNQCKKMTGLTSSSFKNLMNWRGRTLDIH